MLSMMSLRFNNVMTSRYARFLPVLMFLLCVPFVPHAQEARALVDDLVKGAVKGLDVGVQYDLNRSPVKNIYVVFSSHWDIFYTDPDDVLRDQLIRHIEDLIETAKANPDFKWSVESFWQIEGWLRSNPPPERQKELAELIRSGRISVGATQQMLVTLPDELINRNTYQPREWAERMGLPPFQTVVAADFTGGSWGLVQPLARAGAKYMLNSHHIVYMPHDEIGPRELPFWWEGPDGSRLMVWRVEYTSAFFPYCIHPSGAKFLNRDDIGAQAADLPPLKLTEIGIKNQLKKLEAAGYDKDSLLVVCSHDNVPANQAPVVMRHMAEWNATHESPKLIVATPEEFFGVMEKKYGDKLPVKRGDYRQWFWGPIHDSAAGRHAAADTLEAEKAWALLALKGNGGYPEWRMVRQLDNTIESLAHGGGAWEASLLRTAYTDFRTTRLHADLVHQADYMRRTGVAMLGDRIHATSPSIAVMNTLSWARSGVAEALVTAEDFPDGSGLVDPATGSAVPCERDPVEPAWKGKRAEGGAFYSMLSLGELATTRLRFDADNVPGMGFRTLRIERNAGAATVKQPETTTLTLPGVFGNRHWRVSLDAAGQITSLRDLKAGRELVPEGAEERFGGLQVSEQQAGKHGFLDVTSLNLGITTATAILRRGPVETAAEIARPGDALERTEIILAEARPEMRIRCHVNRARYGAMRLSHWLRPRILLPFACEPGKFKAMLQTPGVVRGPEGNNYDHPRKGEHGYGAMWFGCYLSDGVYGVSISSRACYELPLIQDLAKQKYPLVSLLCDPLARGAYDAELPLEIVLTPDNGQADKAEVYRRAWSGAMPLRAKPCRSVALSFWDNPKQFFEDDDGTTDGARGVIAVDAPNVVVAALKQARGGSPRELALRLQEVDGRNKTHVRVTFPSTVREAWTADITGKKLSPMPLRDGVVELNIGPNELATLRLETRNGND